MELPLKYPPEHYARKAERYSAALKWIFNVSVDSTTEERWANVIALSRSIDTYLDEGERALLSARTLEVEAFVRFPEQLGRQFPALSPEEMEQQTYIEFSKYGLGILRTNAHIKSTDSIRRYSLLRRKEGRDYARLISCVATRDVKSQPGYNNFHRNFLLTGEVTNLLNSWRHIRRDFTTGEIALTPDHKTRLHLIGHTAGALFSSVSDSSPKT